jgi:hypothetical protein
MTLEQILEEFPDEKFLKADGFDDAVVGIEFNTMRLVYDKNKMIHILIENDGMDYEDALEYLEFNTWSAYVGEKTPIYIEI